MDVGLPDGLMSLITNDAASDRMLLTPCELNNRIHDDIKYEMSLQEKNLRVVPEKNLRVVPEKNLRVVPEKNAAQAE